MCIFVVGLPVTGRVTSTVLLATRRGAGTPTEAAERMMRKQL